MNDCARHLKLKFVGIPEGKQRGRPLTLVTELIKRHFGQTAIFQADGSGQSPQHFETLSDWRQGTPGSATSLQQCHQDTI